MLLIGNSVYTSNDISVLILITDHVENGLLNFTMSFSTSAAFSPSPLNLFQLLHSTFNINVVHKKK